MEPVSTVTSFLSILKGVINFDPEAKLASKAYGSYTNKSDVESKIKDMATRIVLNKPRTTSITRQVEDSVAHYPLVVSSGISNEVAINLSKINEGRVAEYIKTILQTDRSVIDLDNYQGDIGNFMNNFKSNNAFRMVDVDELIKEGCEQKDYLEICESLMKDDCFYQMLVEKDGSKFDKFKHYEEPLSGALDTLDKKYDSYSKEKEKNKKDIKDAKEKQEKINKKREELQKQLNNQDFLNKYNQAKSELETAELNYKTADDKDLKYADMHLKQARTKFDKLDTKKSSIETALNSIEDVSVPEVLAAISNPWSAGLTGLKIAHGVYKGVKDSKQKEIEGRDKQAIDNIVDRNIRINKSENQTVPTVIEATVTITKGSAIGEKRVYMAVKSMLHIIPGNEMMDAIAGRIAMGGFLTKFIKWYTGEISFIRDLVLNVDEIKRIEGGTSSKGQTAVDKMFDFTRKGSVNSILNGEHFIPTTTLAISIDDVSYLKSISGVDLSVEREASRVMKDLGLLAIMIVDEIGDSLQIFDDGRYSSYEVYSLSGKTKEDKSTTKLMQAFFGSKKV